jgi:hypothetical protein
MGRRHRLGIYKKGDFSWKLRERKGYRVGKKVGEGGGIQSELKYGLLLYIYKIYRKQDWLQWVNEIMDLNYDPEWILSSLWAVRLKKLTSQHKRRRQSILAIFQHHFITGKPQKESTE